MPTSKALYVFLYVGRTSLEIARRLKLIDRLLKIRRAESIVITVQSNLMVKC